MVLRSKGSILVAFALVCLLGCSSVRIDCTGELPTTGDATFGIADSAIRRPLARAIAGEGLLVVPRADALFIVDALLGVEQSDASIPGARIRGLNGGNVGDPADGSGIWIGLGGQREVGTEVDRDNVNDRMPISLAVTMVHAGTGASVFRGVYVEFRHRFDSAQDRDRWVESAISSIVREWRKKRGASVARPEHPSGS